MAAFDEAVGLDLQAFDRGVDVADRAADRARLAHHMPRLQRLPHLELDAARFDRAVEGKAELALRLEPDRIERIARPPKVGENAEKILPDEMRQS